MNISIGNDHAGTDYKFAIKALLESKGITVNNYGTDVNDSVDYADFVHPVAPADCHGELAGGEPNHENKKHQPPTSSTSKSGWQCPAKR